MNKITDDDLDLVSRIIAYGEDRHINELFNRYLPIVERYIDIFIRTKLNYWLQTNIGDDLKQVGLIAFWNNCQPGRLSNSIDLKMFFTISSAKEMGRHIKGYVKKNPQSADVDELADVLPSDTNVYSELECNNILRDVESDPYLKEIFLNGRTQSDVADSTGECRLTVSRKVKKARSKLS